MRRKEINMIAGFILFIFFAMNSFGQNTTTTTAKSGEKRVLKLEKNKIPKEVTDAYAKDFPVNPFPNWYGYPAINDEDWYDSDRYLYKHEDYPENYVVEFMKDNIPYSAFYSKNGKKLAVHRKLTDDLPKEISEAIFKSKYKEWKLGEKEEIYQDRETDKSKVYKVGVEKAKEKRTLYFQSGGKLLKDKKVS